MCNNYRTYFAPTSAEVTVGVSTGELEFTVAGCAMTILAWHCYESYDDAKHDEYGWITNFLQVVVVAFERRTHQWTYCVAYFMQCAGWCVCEHPVSRMLPTGRITGWRVSWDPPLRIETPMPKSGHRIVILAALPPLPGLVYLLARSKLGIFEIWHVGASTTSTW